MKVLQITPHFFPNIGGVETHLNDLIYALRKRKWDIFVLTYQPLTTKVSARIYHKDNRLEVFRIPWFTGLFYKLVTYPLLEFLYLLPGLFFTAPLVLILKKLEIIHAHGLVAGFVGVFWGKIFKKKVIISTHSTYNFPKNGFYRILSKWIFNGANFCLCLSQKSKEELSLLGISKDKLRTFTYWIDLNKFKKIKNAKKILKLEMNFTVLFVGRLVREKGIIELLKSAKKWNKSVILLIIGLGPLQSIVENAALDSTNIKFLGLISQNQLPLYYSSSDILIVPSTSDEGFGRVILESLACGTPVVASNRGAILEVVNERVGKLIDITPENIKNTVEYLASKKSKLNELAKDCRNLTERRYSESNVKKIIQAYEN